MLGNTAIRPADRLVLLATRGNTVVPESAIALSVATRSTKIQRGNPLVRIALPVDGWLQIQTTGTIMTTTA